MSTGRVGLLFVEDDPQEVGRLRQMLTAAWSVAFDVTVAGSVTEAASQLTARRFDVLLLDLSMVADGLERFWAVCPGHVGLQLSRSHPRRISRWPAKRYSMARTSICPRMR